MQTSVMALYSVEIVMRFMVSVIVVLQYYLDIFGSPRNPAAKPRLHRWATTCASGPDRAVRTTVRQHDSRESDAGGRAVRRQLARRRRRLSSSLICTHGLLLKSGESTHTHLIISATGGHMGRAAPPR